MYTYNSILKINLDKIHFDVASSSMINKNIQYCIWDELFQTLKIYWNEELNINDKIILDTIVSLA